MEDSDIRYVRFLNKCNHFKEYRKKKLLRILKTIPTKPESKDVGLVLCPPWGTNYPPLSLAFLASYLSSRKISVKVYDANIKIYNNCTQKDKALWDMSRFKEWFIKDRFDKHVVKFRKLIDYEVEKISTDHKFVCFSVNIGNLRMTNEFIRRLKKKSNAKIIVGGPATIKKEWRQLLEGVDYFILSGEYETLYELYNSVTIKSNVVVPGVIKMSKGKESRYTLKKLNSKDIPSPDFKEFNLEDYELNALPFVLSRGCIQRCNFCGDVYYTPFFYHKDPIVTFNELKVLSVKYGIKRFLAQDLLINGDLNKLETLCDLIISSKLKIQWEGQAILREMPDRLYPKLKESGITTLIFGMETASNRLLKLMNKRHTAELAENVLKKASDCGIFVLINIIVGLPGENDDDFEKTINFIKRNKVHITAILNLNVCEIPQESELFRQKKNLHIKIIQGKNNHPEWYDNKGNTQKKRMQKLRKIYSILKKEKISVFNSNLYMYKNS